MATPPVPPDIKTVLQSIDQRNNDQLLAFFKRKESQPNVLTVEEFRRYAPLFQQVNMTPVAIEANPRLEMLAQEYQRRIDFYKPTHIVKSRADPTVVLRLPQIFVPLRSLSPTPENEKAVAANYTYRQSDLPKIWSRAQNIMTTALFQEQTTPDQVSKIAKARAETKAIMAEIDQVYGRTPADTIQNDVDKTTVVLSADAFEDM